MVYGEPRDTAKLADDVYRALTKGGFHVERFQMNGKVIQCLRVTVRQYDYVGTKMKKSQFICCMNLFLTWGQRSLRPFYGHFTYL